MGDELPPHFEEMPAGDYEEVLAISHVVIFYTEDMKELLNMHLEHSYAFPDPERGGRYTIWMDFTSQEILDVAESRRMIVKFVEGLLARLIEDPRVMSCFDTPFTVDDLYVSIELESYYAHFIDPLYVARIELAEGFLNCYYAADALNPRSVVYHQHVEPYDNARHFVMDEDDYDAMSSTKDYYMIRQERNRAFRRERSY